MNWSTYTTLAFSRAPLPTADPLTVALTALLPGLLILSALLAFILSLFLIRRYRRAIVASMRAESGRAQSETFAESTPVTPPPARLDFTFMEEVAPTILSAQAASAYQQALRAPRIAAWIHAVAGAAFAIVMTVAYLLSGNMELRPLRMIYLFAVFIWPLLPTLILVAAPTRASKQKIIGCYFLVFIGLSLVISAAQENFELAKTFFMPWLIYNLPPTLLLLAFLNRKIRAVGPLVMIFALTIIAGMILTTELAARNDAVLRFVAELSSTFKLSAIGGLLILLVSGAIVLAPLVVFFFRFIRKRYLEKRLSEQALTLDAVWLLFGVEYAIYLAFGGNAWILSGLVAFFAYKILVAFGFALFQKKAQPRQPALTLLLLRVFSLGKRSERLFDALGMHWRYLGSIQMIAGPDLATTNIEPHEFMDFIVGKLARRFIGDARLFEQRLTEADFKSDHDLRFRVNEFFCYNDTWKMALTRLVPENHAVLMDLRGFSPRKSGCIFEINELLNRMPLARVLFIVDHTTDESFLKQTAQTAWQNLRVASPNQHATTPTLRLLRLNELRPRAFAQMLRAVCAAAAPNETTVERMNSWA